MPLVSSTPVVHLELRISPRIFEKILNGPIFRGFGETDSLKKPRGTVPLNVFDLVIAHNTLSTPFTPSLRTPSHQICMKFAQMFCYTVITKQRPHKKEIHFVQCIHTTLIKNIIKFSSYMRKFRMEQLQSHIWLTASSYMSCMGKYLRISSYIRKPFLIYDFATIPLWISLYSIWRKFDFLFLSVYPLYSHVIKHGLELTINYLVMTVRNWIVKCFRISKCKNRFFVFQTCCCNRDAKAMIGCKNQRKNIFMVCAENFAI